MVMVHAGVSCVASLAHLRSRVCWGSVAMFVIALLPTLPIPHLFHHGLLIITSLLIPITGLYKFPLVTKEGPRLQGRNQLGTFAIMAALQISQIAWVRSGLLLQVASLNTHRNSNGSLLCISAQPKTVCSLGFRPYLPSKTLQHYHIWRTNCILV